MSLAAARRLDGTRSRVRVRAASNARASCGRYRLPTGQIVGHADYRELPRLELLRERPDIELVGPGAAILMCEIPERVSDSRGLEEIVILATAGASA